MIENYTKSSESNIKGLKKSINGNFIDNENKRNRSARLTKTKGRIIRPYTYWPYKHYELL